MSVYSKIIVSIYRTRKHLHETVSFEVAIENRVEMSNRVDRSGANFPKSILTMIYGWENTLGTAFTKSKNSKKFTQQK